MDAADYGADGMACHRDVSYLIQTSKRHHGTVSEKPQNKLKLTP